MKEITNIFDFKPGSIYQISNKKSNDDLQYKVISKCIEIKDTVHKSGSSHYILLNDIIVINGGDNELLDSWIMDQSDIEERNEIYEIQEQDYPEYFV